MISAKDIWDVTQKVTKEWTKQRKAEERGRRSRSSRNYLYSDRVKFTEVAADILPAAYVHASGNGKYTVDRRQFYYAARDPFHERTGREIEANYFSQTILVQYMNRHPEQTAHWRITASPRGAITLPNTGNDGRIPCGTIAVEEHLREASEQHQPFDFDSEIPAEWPSVAERQRYQGVLYIEKEGFDPQLREARIAEMFDIAIVSCKGQSVVAARRFVDHVCRVNGGVPLLVVHDFDPYGFSISQRLTSVSNYAREKDLVKYEFKNQIRVIDMGLRLQDVNRYNLKSERFRFKGFPPDTKVTQDEQRFLSKGRRVELNAFTAPQFIEWITAKLTEALDGRRLIPDDGILETAYRRAAAIAAVNNAIEAARESAIADAKTSDIPRALRAQLESMMDEHSIPWDAALYEIAKQAIDSKHHEA